MDAGYLKHTEDQKTMSPLVSYKRPKIGDIIEIKTPKGCAYFQYTHKHPKMGYLIRVLPGLYEKRPNDFTELAQQKESFKIFFTLGSAAHQNIVTIVANESIPEHARAFPVFRSNCSGDPNYSNWWLWDGEKEWRIGELKPEHYQIPLNQIWDASGLIQWIVNGWKMEDLI